MVDDLLSDTEVKALALGDATLESIIWIPSTESPSLRIVLRRLALDFSLLFTWVNRLDIGLTPRGFSAMTWDVSFQRTDDGRWRVRFDFASEGLITFECETIIRESIRRNPSSQAIP